MTPVSFFVPFLHILGWGGWRFEREGIRGGWKAKEDGGMRVMDGLEFWWVMHPSVAGPAAAPPHVGKGGEVYP